MKYRLILSALLTFCSVLSFAQNKPEDYTEVKDYSLDIARAHFKKEVYSHFEGIWLSNDGFRFSIERTTDNDTILKYKFRVIILSNYNQNSSWKENYVKGFLFSPKSKRAYINYLAEGNTIETDSALYYSVDEMRFIRPNKTTLIFKRLYPLFMHNVFYHDSIPSQLIAETYYDKASKKYKDKDGANALKLMDTCILLNSNYARYYAFRGDIYLYRLKDYEKAIKELTMSLEFKQHDDSNLFTRGKAYELSKKYPEAISDFSAYINLHEYNTLAIFRRALSKKAMGDTLGAIADYDAIISKQNVAVSDTTDYTLSTVYNNKAYTLVELGRCNEALPLVNQSLLLDKNKAYAWDTRGEAFYKLGEYEKCISDMSMAISLRKKSFHSYYLRGLAYIVLKKKEEGCADLKVAEENDIKHAGDAYNTNCR